MFDSSNFSIIFCLLLKKSHNLHMFLSVCPTEPPWRASHRPSRTKVDEALRGVPKKKKKRISGVNFVERRGRVKCDVIYEINSREGSGSSREGSGRIPVFFQSWCVWFQTFQNKTKRSPFTYFSKKRNKLESSHEKTRMDSNEYSPENERLEPENTPFEKKHHLPNYLPFWVPCSFSGCILGCPRKLGSKVRISGL